MNIVKIDQVAKVLVGSQHKSHLIVGLVQNPLLYPIHLLPAPVPASRRLSYTSQMSISPPWLALFVPLTKITFHY